MICRSLIRDLKDSTQYRSNGWSRTRKKLIRRDESRAGEKSVEDQKPISMENIGGKFGAKLNAILRKIATLTSGWKLCLGSRRWLRTDL